MKNVGIVNDMNMSLTGLTWRAVAAGAFPRSFHCTLLPPGVILCATHSALWAFVTFAACRNKARLEVEFTGFIS